MKQKFKNMSDTNLLLFITIVSFVLMYVLAVFCLGGGFTKPQSFFDLLNENAALIILACGLSLVMITGSIDISVGGIIALVSMSGAVYLEKANGNVFIALLIALGIGLAFGAFQGYLIAYLEIQPFIVTLAGMFLARGLTTIINRDSFNIESNEAFKAVKNVRIEIPGLGTTNKHGIYNPAYITIGVIVALLIVLILFCVLRWTRLGRSFYAVGGNNQSALMLGINVKKSKFMAHLLCGLLGGIGGFVFLLNLGSGAVSNGGGFEMLAIASAIIGGTMLTGGVGNIVGSLLGVLSLRTIQNIVRSIGLDEAWWTEITVGAMLCIFLVIQSVVMARKGKKKE